MPPLNISDSTAPVIQPAFNLTFELLRPSKALTSAALSFPVRNTPRMMEAEPIVLQQGKKCLNID